MKIHVGIAKEALKKAAIAAEREDWTEFLALLDVAATTAAAALVAQAQTGAENG